ncbi:hypothetical protein WICMUC_004102 [Wickerhamomyces mucosus]|uniref:Retrograde transport protein Dsl1 C-terminal domain-containing protein n=1 Tax=Wickerhamomyces mucosus TaxID=1378264 RepID=A0A9P8TBZ3_9ASCO|nr:hypothetical protein WICMUC_004102 [Wickerhamomyces mucosus]
MTAMKHILAPKLMTGIFDDKEPGYLVKSDNDSSATKIERLNSHIRQLTSQDELKSQLKSNFDVLANLDRSPSDKEQLESKLSKLQELWVISNLLNEIETNLEINEFENVFHSLKILESKIKSIKSDDVFTIEKLTFRHRSLYESAITKLSDIIKKLIVEDYESLTINQSVTENQITLNFNDIYSTIVQNGLETRLKLDVAHVIDQKVLSKLISFNKFISFDYEKRVIFKEPNNTLDDYIQSVMNLFDFISLFPMKDHIVSYITNRLFEWLKEIIRTNIENIYNNELIKSNFLKLHTFLQSNGIKRLDLEIWINSQLFELMIDFFYQDHFNRIKKELLKNDDSFWENTKEFPNPEGDSARSEDQDGWDEWDDNWDNKSIQKSQTEQKSKQENDEELWDAWDDGNSTGDAEWDTWEDKDSVSENKQISQLNRSNVKKLPDVIHSIIIDYLSTATKLPEEYKQIHFSNLNYLATSYYMFLTTSTEYENNELSIYNQLRYFNGLIKIPRLIELTDTLLFKNISELEGKLSDIIYIDLNGLDPAIGSSETYNQIYRISEYFEEFFNKLVIINKEDFNKASISIINEFYQIVIDSVFKKQQIGEEESAYLNTVIGNFLDVKQFFKTYNSSFVNRFVKNYSKLTNINFIIINHLKDIMESFYDGVFYDLSTDEIIDLVDKLFADSELKRSYILEIREIRETT